jgi:rRNA maturation RNase YbeY
MPVTVQRRSRLQRPVSRVVSVDARRLLRALDEHQAELGIALVDDAEMQELNRVYRHRDRPTDVLAFAAREGQRVPGDEEVLGDVVISLETALRQARQRGHSAAVEVRTLLTHGVLHLAGYDHERSPADARRMFARQRQLVAALDEADQLARR